MLHIRGLTKRFGRREVVCEVDLDVVAGEIVVLVGENGAGKSSLIRCVGGASVPDHGTIAVDRGAVAVVWQDLSLCDNLDAVANIYLGTEPRHGLLRDDLRRVDALRLFHDLGVAAPDLDTPVGLLSGGERQVIAIARALARNASVLVLDEPTAALGVSVTAAIEALLVRLRQRGMAILMVSHRIDQVFQLADRIAIMRHGRIVSTVQPREVHPDDVVAQMSGVATETTARRNLRQLRQLVDDLADVEPTASLPLILTSLSRALSNESLGLWLRGDDNLVLHAHVGLDEAAVTALTTVAPGPAGGLVGVAADGGRVIVEDTAGDAQLAAISPSAWAFPVTGSGRHAAVIAGFAPHVGRPGFDQLELIELHAKLATAAIERETLVDQLTQRNRVLESLRGILDQLAGPAPVDAGISIALEPLRRALNADALALYESIDGGMTERAATSAAGSVDEPQAVVMCDAASRAVCTTASVQRPQLSAGGIVTVPISVEPRVVVLVAIWREAAGGDVDGREPTAESLDLLEDASRSLSLAVEREDAEAALRESKALRRANQIQREFLYRLSHELRTPLTAITGYADTLRQTDVDWEEAAQQRFLRMISSESTRMGRLVGDLLDASALEGGQLRMNFDWTDVALMIESAVDVARASGVEIATDLGSELPQVLCDHDRLEQVLVNGLDNAAKYGAEPIIVRARAVTAEGRAAVEIAVVDHGSGPPARLGDSVFEPYVRGATTQGAGIGLAISRGIVDAHGGTIVLGRRGIATVLSVVLPVQPAQASSPDGVLLADEGLAPSREG